MTGEVGSEHATRPAIADCHILVVDDTDFNRTLIGAILEDAGYRSIAYAKDGFEALEQVERQPPDLLVLDIMMPGMDGFEVCRNLRANPAHADIPVLVQTALSSSDDRNRAFAVGTTDLITKPIERVELLARVRIHLENRVLIRDLTHYRTRVEGELAVARSMQDHLLPNPALLAAASDRAGIALRVHSLPAPDMGADIWGVVPVDGRRLGVYLLDMAGRGVTAALNAFRMHTLLHEPSAPAADPAAFLTDLNRRAANLLDKEDSAALLYGVVDAETGTFTYAAAAAMAPLLLTADGQVQNGTAGDTAAGPPVGTAADTRYQAHTVAFPPGSALILCSDAIHGGAAGAGSDNLAALVVMAVREGAATAGADRFSLVTTTLATALGDTPGDDHTLIWIEHDNGIRGTA